MNANMLYVLVYGILGAIYYFAGLRIWNKGRKNIVNLDVGRLQLYAILTMLIGLLITYYIANATIESLASWLAGLGVLGMTKRNAFIDILDGRGQIGKKFDKILIVALGVVIGFLAISYISTFSFATTLLSITPYFFEMALCIFGIWMIGNKDDNLTKFGMGMLAGGVLLFLIHAGIFG